MDSWHAGNIWRKVWTRILGDVLEALPVLILCAARLRVDPERRMCIYCHGPWATGKIADKSTMTSRASLTNALGPDASGPRRREDGAHLQSK